MTLKGCTRQTVVLNGEVGGIFERAYFILRSDLPARTGSGDMLREANRIVREHTFSRSPRRLRKLKIKLFALGALSGSAAVGLAWLVFSLILR